MQKSRFTEAQMVTILREADRGPVPEVAKQHGVSAQTIYSWRKHFGTLEPADVKRLRQLEQENGPEFIATALLRWLQTVEIDTAFIDPGKPWQNGTDESFNGKFRNECLSLEWFRNRMEAKIGIERWRRHYNEERPHMSLGDLTPAEFKKQMGTDPRLVRREPNGRHSPVISGPKKPGRSVLQTSSEKTWTGQNQISLRCPGGVLMQQARDQGLVRQPLGQRALLDRLQILAR